MGDHTISVAGGEDQPKDELANKIKDMQRLLDFLLKEQDTIFDKQYQLM